MSVTAEQPVWLRRVTQPGIGVFGIMFALESLSRSTLAALIPLQAYAILHEARNVSLPISPSASPASAPASSFRC
jgi:hypothetical protein